MMDLSYTPGIFHSKAAEYTFFFKCTQNILQHRTYAMPHTKNLSKFKKTEIPSIFSDHNIMRLEINCKKKLQNTQTHGG